MLRSFAAEPIEVTRSLPGEFRQRYGNQQYAAAEESWEEHLHRLIGAPWPCPERDAIDEVMADITARLAAGGLRFGRNSYGWYADADISLCHAVWCTVLHTRPSVVIETGVAHGITSRIILEAMQRNDHGHLWSIDLPFPFDHELHGQTGVAVTDECRSRWSYIEGRSRQRLPRLVSEVGQVQMFIHDSLHTARNTAFELTRAASAMPSGGVLLADDIKMHRGFDIFAKKNPAYQTVVCPHTDEIGMFGIAVNTSQ